MPEMFGCPKCLGEKKFIEQTWRYKAGDSRKTSDKSDKLDKNLITYILVQEVKVLHHEHIWFIKRKVNS